MRKDFLTNIGDIYKDFNVTKITFIDELNCTLREIEHTISGAQIIHIENDDPENLFCLSFKTLPSSSNGVAHILEHCVLCGSKKFPVKDPFFSMSRRSLNTFMNALTGSDFTCYPAASQVEKDFYNLMEIYLDAVFHPELKKESFLQEGCRLAFSQAEDSNSPLEYKGIVFNEMKGALSSVDSRLWHLILNHLVPDLSYAYNSGGDPKEIPNLSYDELVSFYRTYYHPSRCLFFFYGNFCLKKHLDFIENNGLQGIEKLPPLPPIPLQNRFSQPVKKTFSYPTVEDNESSQTIISFSWLTCQITNQEDLLALGILDALLMNTDASLLKKLLLDSGLCSQADAFMDAEMREVPYVIICKGCDIKNIEIIEQTLFASLKKIADQPIPKHLIDAIIHQIELSRLEIKGDHAPFGLTLFFRSALSKQHGCEPENSLIIYSLFEKLSEKAKDPDFLKKLLQKYLIHNNHFVRIAYTPDKELATKEAEEEKATLEHLQLSLTQEQKLFILRQTQALEEYQQNIEHQNIDCLPTVNLTDVPRLAKQIDLSIDKYPHFEIFYHECFTNHVLYADLYFDIPLLEESELPYLHLLLNLIPHLGAGDRNYLQNLEYLQAHTGGVSLSYSLNPQVDDISTLRPTLRVKGKSLGKNADKLFQAMKQIIASPILNDKKRIEELLKQIQSSLHSRLPRSALKYAIQEALSSFHASSFITNSLQGLKYYHTIQDICKNLSENISPLIEKLIALKDKIFTFHNPNLVLSCDMDIFTQIYLQNFYGLFTDLPSAPFVPWVTDYLLPKTPSQGRFIAAPIAYSVKAFSSIPYLHVDSAALTVASQLFENKVLLSSIREKGGAYGAGANYNSNSATFYFHSYRDPHILSTLDAFDDAIDLISLEQFSCRDLEEAKIGIIQHIDSPTPPGKRGITAYNWLKEGKTLQMRQKFREKLLSLDTSDVAKAVDKHLKQQKENGVIVCFGNQELIQKENAKLKSRKKELTILSI